MNFEIGDFVRVNFPSSFFYNQSGKIKDIYDFCGRKICIIEFVNKICGTRMHHIYCESLDLIRPIDLEKICKKKD